MEVLSLCGLVALVLKAVWKAASSVAGAVTTVLTAKTLVSCAQVSILLNFDMIIITMIMVLCTGTSCLICNHGDETHFSPQCYLVQNPWMCCSR